jgi:pilus assembly protein TadC
VGGAGVLAVALAAAAAGALTHRAPARLPAPASAGAEPASSRAGPGAPALARLAWPVAAAAVLALVPPALGLPLAGAVLLGGPRLVARLEPGAVRRERARLQADLPLVLDLLAACLAGGATLPSAADAVGTAVGGPAGERLTRVAAALQLGTPAELAWLALAGEDLERDPLAPAARALARSADSGSAVAAALIRVSGEARRTSRSAGAEAARRAGVLAVAPLGLCHLPAFVLLGVVPVVVGLAGPVLGQR